MLKYQIPCSHLMSDILSWQISSLPRKLESGKEIRGDVISRNRISPKRRQSGQMALHCPC